MMVASSTISVALLFGNGRVSVSVPVGAEMLCIWDEQMRNHAQDITLAGPVRVSIRG